MIDFFVFLELCLESWNVVGCLGCGDWRGEWVGVGFKERWCVGSGVGF